MSKQQLYFYGWRIAVATLAVAILIYNIIDRWSVSGFKFWMDTFIWTYLLGNIVYGIFTHHFRPCSFRQYIAAICGKNSLHTTILIILGITLVGILSISGFIYCIDKDLGAPSSFLEILSFVSLAFITLLPFIGLIKYIKCCTYKPEKETAEKQIR